MARVLYQGPTYSKSVEPHHFLENKRVMVLNPHTLVRVQQRKIKSFIYLLKKEVTVRAPVQEAPCSPPFFIACRKLRVFMRCRVSQFLL